MSVHSHADGLLSTYLGIYARWRRCTVFYDHVLEAFATAIDVKHVQDWGVGLGCGYRAWRPRATRGEEASLGRTQGRVLILHQGGAVLRAGNPPQKIAALPEIYFELQALIACVNASSTIRGKEPRGGRCHLRRGDGAQHSPRIQCPWRRAFQHPVAPALNEIKTLKYNCAREADYGGAGAARMRVNDLATGEIATSDTQSPTQLPHHKVKIKKTGQRACNEKNEKGKFCGGHLKRWFYTTDVIEQACGDAEKAWGKNAEVYRCEHCKTLYLPSPEDAKVNVAGKGRISVFGLTLPPKEK